ncbi:MAG: ABC transporter permease subunit [Dehalococcoidia bacterium]|jgi:general L-amino acid transport system permease protein|nr:ABC transporter permease subunit [Dehalococcoidia bacterium]
MASTAGQPPTPSFWQSQRGQRMLYQGIAAFVLLLLTLYFISRALTLDLSIDFMSQKSGFSIANQWLTGIDSQDSRWAIYGAGTFNTVRLVVVGIILATLLGVLMGVARLSSNWLISRLAAVYVEVIRNTPLLVQIIFWHTAVLLQLPRISENVNVGGIAFLSNRALALPWPQSQGLSGVWVILLLASAAFAWWIRQRRLTEEDETGRSTHANAVALGSFLVLAVGTYVATGLPVGIDAPTLTTSDTGTQDYLGGIKITPEFAALLFALVFYTGSFITEIVRGSIQALPRGQNEAAAALGLSGYQRMTLIILPQALRIMIPAITNQFLNLSKNSSLAIVIGYSELFFVSSTIVNNAGRPVPMFTVVIATYLVLNLLIAGGMNWLNRRVQLANV